MDNHEQSRVLMLDLDGSRTKTIILNNKKLMLVELAMIKNII